MVWGVCVSVTLEPTASYPSQYPLLATSFYHVLWTFIRVPGEGRVGIWPWFTHTALDTTAASPTLVRRKCADCHPNVCIFL